MPTDTQMPYSHNHNSCRLLSRHIWWPCRGRGLRLNTLTAQIHGLNHCLGCTTAVGAPAAQRRLSPAAGQGSPNIHADSTNITGTINAFTTPQLDRLRRRVEEVVNASGAMYGAQVSTQWTKQAYVPVRNDAGMLAVVRQALQGGRHIEAGNRVKLQEARQGREVCLMHAA